MNYPRNVQHFLLSVLCTIALSCTVYTTSTGIAFGSGSSYSQSSYVSGPAGGPAPYSQSSYGPVGGPVPSTQSSYSGSGSSYSQSSYSSGGSSNSNNNVPYVPAFVESAANIVWSALGATLDGAVAVLQTVTGTPKPTYTSSLPTQSTYGGSGGSYSEGSYGPVGGPVPVTNPVPDYIQREIDAQTTPVSPVDILSARDRAIVDAAKKAGYNTDNAYTEAEVLTATAGMSQSDAIAALESAKVRNVPLSSLGGGSTTYQADVVDKMVEVDGRRQEGGVPTQSTGSGEGASSNGHGASVPSQGTYGPAGGPVPQPDTTVADSISTDGDSAYTKSVIQNTVAEAEREQRAKDGAEKARIAEQQRLIELNNIPGESLGIAEAIAIKNEVRELADFLVSRGATPDEVSGVEIKFARSLVAEIKKAEEKTGIIDTNLINELYRPPEVQAQYYADYIGKSITFEGVVYHPDPSKFGRDAAAPNRSRHQRGSAADLNSGVIRDEIRSNAAVIGQETNASGLEILPGGKDQPHIQMNSNQYFENKESSISIGNITGKDIVELAKSITNGIIQTNPIGIVVNAAHTLLSGTQTNVPSSNNSTPTLTDFITDPIGSIINLFSGTPSTPTPSNTNSPSKPKPVIPVVVTPAVDLYVVASGATPTQSTSTLGTEYRFAGSLKREILYGEDGLPLSDIQAHYGTTIHTKLSVDYLCDSTVNASTTLTTPYTAFDTEQDLSTVLLSTYMRVTEPGTHCYYFTTDTTEVVSEKDESNRSNGYGFEVTLPISN